MNTENFSVGVVKKIGEVSPTTKIFSPKKKPHVTSIHVTLSSDYNKNVGIHFRRREALLLIKKLQKALK